MVNFHQLFRDGRFINVSCQFITYKHVVVAFIAAFPQSVAGGFYIGSCTIKPTKAIRRMSLIVKNKTEVTLCIGKFAGASLIVLLTALEYFDMHSAEVCKQI